MNSLTEIFQLGLFIKDAFYLWPFFCIRALDSEAFASLYKCWCSVRKCHNMTLWCVATFLHAIKENFFISPCLSMVPKELPFIAEGGKKKKGKTLNRRDKRLRVGTTCGVCPDCPHRCPGGVGGRRGQSGAKSARAGPSVDRWVRLLSSGSSPGRAPGRPLCPPHEVISGSLRGDRTSL